MLAIYAKYNPDFEEAKIDKLLNSHKGKEETLVKKLMSKYAPDDAGPTPTPAQSEAPASPGDAAWLPA